VLALRGHSTRRLYYSLPSLLPRPSLRDISGALFDRGYATPLGKPYFGERRAVYARLISPGGELLLRQAETSPRSSAKLNRPALHHIGASHEASMLAALHRLAVASGRQFKSAQSCGV